MRLYRKVLMCTIIVVLSICLFGCKDKDEFKPSVKQHNNYKLYYVNSKREKIVYDDFVLKSTDLDRMINEIIMKLKVGNYTKSKEPVIPTTVESSMYNLSANILSLNFDKNYYDLKGRDEVLRRAAIVMTFCQLDEIDYVRITVAGKALQVDNKDIGNMSKESFIDLIGKDSDYMIDESVTLYFADSSGKKIRKLNTKIVSDGTVKLEELVVERLIQGPKGSDKLGYYPTIDENTRINRIAVNNNICYIDFDENFLSKPVGISEDVVIYSVVNSLTDLKTVNQVKITVNGEVREVYNDYAKMDGCIERSYDIVNEGKK